MSEYHFHSFLAAIIFTSNQCVYLEGFYSQSGQYPPLPVAPLLSELTFPPTLTTTFAMGAFWLSLRQTQRTWTCSSGCDPWGSQQPLPPTLLLGQDAEVHQSLIVLLTLISYVYVILSTGNVKLTFPYNLCYRDMGNYFYPSIFLITNLYNNFFWNSKEGWGKSIWSVKFTKRQDVWCSCAFQKWKWDTVLLQGEHNCSYS